MARILQDCIQKPGTQSTTPANYVPANSSKRPVSRGDSFTSIANALGMDPWALVWFNFPSVGQRPSQRAAREVNWYLQEYLGCKEVTRDQKNYLFHDGMRRPFIYIPISTVDFSGTVFTATLPMDAWCGIGWKQSALTGAILMPEVNEEQHGWMVSFDNFQDWFGFTVRGKRYGLNVSLSGAAGAVAYVATGLETPRQLNDHEISGVDYSLQLGPAGKGLKDLSTTSKLGKFAIKAGMTYDKWEEVVTVFKGVVEALGIDLKSPTPKLHVIEIPFASLGIEASLYYLKAKLTVDHVSINVGRRVTVDEGVDLP